MVLIFYILLNIIALLLFRKMNKNLHVLEIFMYWIVSSYLFQNLSALCSMNLKTLIIPEILSYEFAHVLNRIVLFPAIMVIFLNFYQVSSSQFKKLLLFICFFLLLLSMEWLSHFLGVLIHNDWQIWWSFSFWLIALLVLIGFMRFFRRILYKGA